MDKNENQMTPPLQSLDKETKPQFKHKVLAIINFVMGMFYIFFPLVTIFFVLPKMKALYESFDVKQLNFLTTYFLSLVLVIVGILNIFVGLKLLAKSTVNREKYFKVGVILAVITFFLMSISQAFIIPSVISPMYNLVGTIDQNVPSVTPAPSPTPTTDPTANLSRDEVLRDWKEYRNENITFKFPSGWIEKPILLRGSGFYQDFEDPKGKFTFTFSGTLNYSQLTGKPYATLDEFINMPYRVKTVIVDGQEGRQPLPRAGSENDNLAYFFSKDSKIIYGIELKTGNTTLDTPETDVKEGQKLFNQILSTFKFLD